jgi:CheY-like chemotaxis protein
MKILVVEDEICQLLRLKKSLSDAGHEVRCASKGHVQSVERQTSD